MRFFSVNGSMIVEAQRYVEQGIKPVCFCKIQDEDSGEIRSVIRTYRGDLPIEEGEWIVWDVINDTGANPRVMSDEEFCAQYKPVISEVPKFSEDEIMRARGYEPLGYVPSSFVWLTEREFKTEFILNTSKIKVLERRESGTKILLDEGDAFEVTELPEQIFDRGLAIRVWRKTDASS